MRTSPTTPSRSDAMRFCGLASVGVAVEADDVSMPRNLPWPKAPTSRRRERRPQRGRASARVLRQVLPRRTKDEALTLLDGLGGREQLAPRARVGEHLHAVSVSAFGAYRQTPTSTPAWSRVGNVTRWSARPSPRRRIASGVHARSCDRRPSVGGSLARSRSIHVATSASVAAKGSGCTSRVPRVVGAVLHPSRGLGAASSTKRSRSSKTGRCDDRLQQTPGKTVEQYAAVVPLADRERRVAILVGWATSRPAVARPLHAFQPIQDSPDWSRAADHAILADEAEATQARRPARRSPRPRSDPNQGPSDVGERRLPPGPGRAGAAPSGREPQGSPRGDPRTVAARRRGHVGLHPVTGPRRPSATQRVTAVLSRPGEAAAGGGRAVEPSHRSTGSGSSPVAHPHRSRTSPAWRAERQASLTAQRRPQAVSLGRPRAAQVWSGSASASRAIRAVFLMPESVEH